MQKYLQYDALKENDLLHFDAWASNFGETVTAIKDNYLRFWFAFVYPNMSFIESGHSNIALTKIKQGLIKNHATEVAEKRARINDRGR